MKLTGYKKGRSAFRIGATQCIVSQAQKVALARTRPSLDPVVDLEDSLNNKHGVHLFTAPNATLREVSSQSLSIRIHQIQVPAGRLFHFSPDRTRTRTYSSRLTAEYRPGRP